MNTTVISGKRKMSNEEKILRALYVIHQENEVIMRTVLSHTCYPKDYEETEKKIMRDWDKAFDKAIGYEEE